MIIVNIESKICVWVDIFHNSVLLLFTCAGITTVISLLEEKIPKDIRREWSNRQQNEWS